VLELYSRPVVSN